VASALSANNECLKTPAHKGSDLSPTTVALQKLSSTQGNYCARRGTNKLWPVFVAERGASLRPSNLFYGAHLV